MIRFRTLILLAVLVCAAGACSRDAGGEQAAEKAPGKAPGPAAVAVGPGMDMGHGVVGWRPGVTRSEFMALPDSVRLDSAEADASFGDGRGVAVEVTLHINGLQGKSVPMAYSLHDARNGLPFVSRTIPITPDAPRWSRQGQVWLPVPSPGSYFVRVVLNDSTGRKDEGPRTRDFTIQ
jgi:hypothetical protein